SIVFLGITRAATAQLTPHLADVKHPVKGTFKAPTVILTNSVKNLYANTLNMSIYHTFGLVSSGVNQLYGLDSGANIRLGLDYGITDKLSVGIGRVRLGKIVDGRFKYTLLQQMKKDSNGPISLAVSGDLGITTDQKPFSGSYTTGDRMNYMLQAIAARKFSNKFSFQIAPIFAHYNRVYPGEHNNYFGVGLDARYKLTGHTALALEYIPTFNKNPNTYNTVAIALNMETGGHVFQLFFTNSQSFDQQGLLRNTQNDFWAGDFRFGFNINRIFWFKGKPK
ncbi:MAG TPA: DUF5777 family beta-barrel protein, partial [Balneolaceae bacterium]|nr:DUF5777 family beta-barrel protein [Balneolaceae bacterium]